MPYHRRVINHTTGEISVNITFDPLNPAEVAAVCKLLGLGPLATAAVTECMTGTPAGPLVTPAELKAIMIPKAPAPSGNDAPSTAAVAPSQIAPAVLEGFSGASTSAQPAVSAPVPPAPSAPASPASPASGVELDIHGLPWDARIHSGGESRKNADGSWRKRRGLNDPAMVKRVEDELRAAAGGGAPLAHPGATAANATALAAPITASASVATVPAAPIAMEPETGTPPEPPVPAAPAVDAGVPPIPPVPPVPATSPPAIAPIPSAPPVPAAPTAAAPSAGATGYTVPEVIHFVNTKLNVEKVVTNDDLDASLQRIGIPAGQFAMLFGTTAEKVQEFMADFQARLKAKQQ